MTTEELIEDVRTNGEKILGRKMTEKEIEENAEALVDYFETLLSEDCDGNEEAANDLFNKDFFDKLKEQLENND